MTWYTVPTHSPGDLVTAADWNAMARDLTGRAVPTVLATAGGFTFNDPGDGVSRLRIRVGGGGAGGAAATSTSAGEASCGGGGGSGGYSESTLLVTSITFPVTITVGAAGLGGSTSGAAGAAGGDSSFGPYVIARGAGQVAGTALATSLAAASSTAWATGGDGAFITGAVGQILSGGNCGQMGIRIAGSPIQARGGAGAPGPFGGAIRPHNSYAAGVNGQGPGSGGSGAAIGASTTFTAGGNGVAGIVIVELLY